MESPETSKAIADAVGEIKLRGQAPEYAVVTYRHGYPDRQVDWFLSYEGAEAYARNRVYNYPHWIVMILKPFAKVVKEAPTTRVEKL